VLGREFYRSRARAEEEHAGYVLVDPLIDEDDGKNRGQRAEWSDG
jgi:hypothetical protein